MPPRVLAIGDIHGYAAALESLLAAIALKGDDTLVALGFRQFRVCQPTGKRLGHGR